MTDLNTQTEQELNDEWKAVCMAWCRKERDEALKDSDYIHMPDVTVSDSYVTSMNTYRQSLRDFPATWETTFNSMTAEQKDGVTPESIREALPAKP